MLKELTPLQLKTLLGENLLQVSMGGWGSREVKVLSSCGDQGGELFVFCAAFFFLGVVRYVDDILSTALRKPALDFLGSEWKVPRWGADTLVFYQTRHAPCGHCKHAKVCSLTNHGHTW